ncbi:MAG: single-stranded DNA-binding protein [Desulfobacteraceae bacterium]
MLNKIELIGRLGGDPEVRYTPSGTAVANFSLATSEKFTDQNTGEKREETQWHRCVAWNRLAEICGQYLGKGSLVYVEGKMTYRKWQDNDGNDRYSAEVRVNRMLMLDTKGQGQGQGKPPAQDHSYGEDIPF